MGVSLNKVCFEDKITNISYEFQDMHITSVIASSGMGKSVLAEVIAGLRKETSGSINCSYSGRSIGYICQNAEESFIFSTVREEVMFGLKKYNYKTNILDKRIRDSLKLVGLDNGYLDRNPFSLSSGERKLVSIASTLALNPKIIVIDGIEEGLDNSKRIEIIKLLKLLRDRYHKTIILFTSDINFAIEVMDDYVVIKNGKIINHGTKKDIINNFDKIKKAKVEIPEIIEFIMEVKKKKKIELDMTMNILELMKDIYRNVR